MAWIRDSPVDGGPGGASSKLRLATEAHSQVDKTKGQIDEFAIQSD